MTPYINKKNYKVLKSQKPKLKKKKFGDMIPFQEIGLNLVDGYETTHFTDDDSG